MASVPQEKGMTMRQKLIELLKTIPQVNHAQAQVEGMDYVFGCAADYLITNGVRLETKRATSEENKRGNRITYEERAKVYAGALDTYGATNQMMKALEELNEVAIEIHRILGGRPSILHLAEEVADATIMLEQLRMTFDINDDVCKFMDAKVLRLQP